MPNSSPLSTRRPHGQTRLPPGWSRANRASGRRDAALSQRAQTTWACAVQDSLAALVNTVVHRYMHDSVPSRQGSDKRATSNSNQIHPTPDPRLPNKTSAAPWRQWLGLRASLSAQTYSRRHWIRRNSGIDGHPAAENRFADCAAMERTITCGSA